MTANRNGWHVNKTNVIIQTTLTRQIVCHAYAILTGVLNTTRTCLSYFIEKNPLALQTADWQQNNGASCSNTCHRHIVTVDVNTIWWFSTMKAISVDTIVP